GMMTAAPVTITAPGISVIDFTLPGTALYGTAAMSTNGGVRTQWSGNVVRDGSLRYTGASNDRDPILVAVGGTVPTATTTGYRVEDVNMDAVVKYTGANNDRDPILVSVGGTIPTAVRMEQLP
ncbi:MAG: hypothetical protein WAU70_08010, partial [Flavobacteriales bacterium]